MSYAKTEYAKQLFLYGLPNEGRPVVETKRLSELSGCSLITLQRHRPAWERERDEMLANASPSALALRVSKADLERHKSDIDFLRTRLDSTLAQLDKLPECLERLEGFLDAYTKDATKADSSTALRAFEAYLGGLGAAKSLDSHFLTLQKRWVELNGISDMQSVGTSRDKAMAIAQSKLEASKAFAERQAAREPRKISGFARAADEPIEGLD